MSRSSDQPPIRVKTYRGVDTATAGRAYLADAVEAARHGYVAVSHTWQGTSLTVVYEHTRDPADPDGPPGQHAAGPDRPKLTPAHVETALPATEARDASVIRPVAIAGVLTAAALSIGLVLLIGVAGVSPGGSDTPGRVGETLPSVEIPTAVARPGPEAAPALGVAGDYRCLTVADAVASIDAARLTFYGVVPSDAPGEWLVYKQAPRPGFEQATFVTLYAADPADERLRDCPAS